MKRLYALSHRVTLSFFLGLLAAVGNSNETTIDEFIRVRKAECAGFRNTIDILYNGLGLAEIKELGEGGQGRVTLCSDRSNKEIVIKYLDYSKACWGLDRGENKQFFLDENPCLVKPRFVILYHLNERFVIHYKDKDKLREWVESDRTACSQTQVRAIAFDYFPAIDLFDYIHSNEYSGFNNDEKLKFLLWVFINLCDVLKFIHDNGIVYLDLKMENVLIRKDRLAMKLIDFGCCRSVRNKLSERGGSISSMAPEVVAGEVYDQTADLWSFGAVMFSTIYKTYLYDIFMLHS